MADLKAGRAGRHLVLHRPFSCFSYHRANADGRLVSGAKWKRREGQVDFPFWCHGTDQRHAGNIICIYLPGCSAPEISISVPGDRVDRLILYRG